MFDLLNQNRSIVRNVTDTYTEEVQSRVLNRYFMLSFVITCGISWAVRPPCNPTTGQTGGTAMVCAVADGTGE